MDTIKSYKDAVTANARLFGSNVDHILYGFKNSMEKNAKLANNDAHAVLNNIRHQLRQLELKGQLKKDRVQAVLDKARHEVIREKLMTEAEWKKAYSHFEATYAQPTWYQRVFRLKPNIQDIESSSLKSWILSVTNNLNHLGTLTKEQVTSIGDALYQSILKTDIHKLGDNVWVEELKYSISQQTQLKKEQLEDVMEAIAKEVRAFKIFALDYTGQAKEQTSHWIHSVKNRVWTTVEGLMKPIRTRLSHYRHHLPYADPTSHPKWEFYNYKDAHLKYPGEKKKLTASIQSQARSMSKQFETATATNVITHAFETAVSVASEAAAQATSSVKDSFAHFWRQKEHDIYRRLGYTEAHIDWIQNYLEKTFQNQKDSVKGKADEAAIAIKRYLDSCKVQTPNQVDASVHRMKRYLEAWRTLVD